MANISFIDKGIKSIAVYDKNGKTLSSTIETIIDLCGYSKSSTNNGRRPRKTIQPCLYTNTIFVIMNGFGLGSQSLEDFHEPFDKLNKILDEANSYVCFLRGCNDEPKLFNGDKPFADGRIMAIPDYSLISIKDFTCLCIGGGLSIDKQWKLSNEQITGQKEFYENELPFYNGKLLDETINGSQIHAVCTYEPPTFMLPSTNHLSKISWFEANKELVHKQIEASGVIDKVYFDLTQKMKMPSNWICANHLFDSTNSFILGGTYFMFAPVNTPNILFTEGHDEILSKLSSKLKLTSTSTISAASTPIWYEPLMGNYYIADGND